MICTYERTVFENVSNGFRIASYTTNDRSVPETARNKFCKDSKIRFTAVGHHIPTANAVDVDLCGRWENGKYGMQYAVDSFTEIVPTTKRGIIGYLSSGLIKGIGEKTAEAIVNKFGANALNIIENEPEKLLEISGITEKNLAVIVESYNQSRNLQQIMTMLSSFGISVKKAVKIQKTFGADTMDILQNNPFRLCEITGFGFKTVDHIARKTACKPNDPMRIRGAVTYF
jgi:exodeoxyribonuclease V alpha subunit